LGADGSHSRAARDGIGDLHRPDAVRAAIGAQFIGFCSPTDDSGLDSLQPVILTSDGPVYFWFGEFPSHEFLVRQAARLGVMPAEIFAVQFRCTVPIEGRFVAGVITEGDLTGAA
jgi:hypothetical protein